ncbi:ArsR family transcriptional regulator [Natronobeatus ordinarius]|uniref:ArsR family transcriptional regulator n=1 Tax=Natronobeatus ordinarius TaxID=2963433 RepID=UPI0020CC73A4|nr:HTH domain-containing protein [Natronobeatus ordinarius]
MSSINTSCALPDALVDVDDPRVAVWLALRSSGGPRTGPELVDETEFSTSTVYRSLKQLEADGLARSRPRVSATADVASSEWQVVSPASARPAVLLADVVELLEAVPWEDVRCVSREEVDSFTRRLETAREEFIDDEPDERSRRKASTELR